MEAVSQCHPEVKPKNLVFVSGLKLRDASGSHPEPCRRAQHDTNGIFDLRHSLVGEKMTQGYRDDDRLKQSNRPRPIDKRKYYGS